jgi:hypothetical protein
MYLQQHLKKFFSTPVRERGAAVYGSGSVARLSGNQWRVSASVNGTYLYNVSLARTDNRIDAQCGCPYFESDGLCKHIWATVLAADAKNYLLGRIGSGPPSMIEENRTDGAPLEELLVDSYESEFYENRRSAPGRNAGARAMPRKPDWRAALALLKSRPQARKTQEVWREDREIYYVIDAPRVLESGDLALEVVWREKRKGGAWGKLKNTRIARAFVPQIPDERDREILLTLGGVPEAYSYSGESIPCSYHVRRSLSRLLLPKLCASGRCCLRSEPAGSLESMTRLSWDDGPAWEFRLSVEPAGKRWIVRGHLTRGGETMPLSEPALLLEEGLVFARGRIAALDHNGSFDWIVVLREISEIEAPGAQGYDLVAAILNQPSLPPVDWPEKLKFEQISVAPRICLKVTKSAYSWRSQDELWASLSFEYGGIVIGDDHASRGLYDPGQRRFWQRDKAAEQAAAERLEGLGAKRISPHYGQDFRPRWEFSSRKLPKLVRELVLEGWQIESEGKLFRNGAGFRAELTSGIDWFELHGTVDYGSEQAELPDLIKALERGDNLLRLSDGSYGLIPDELKEKYGLLIRLGKKHGDHLRYSRAQAGFLDLLLAGRDEVRVDELFARVRAEVQRFERIAPTEQPAGFSGQLRDYQLDGLAWMQFLRQFSFGGCLADDMGVGKTPQVLALLETRRVLRDSNANGNGNGDLGPSLAVVPRSLVYNWKREAERFTPRLRVLDHTGMGRQKNLDKLSDYDLILTTYGTLRRDAADLQTIRFDYVILDEAQAIKNAGSESAKAARLLRGSHRLALSGTPVENHLGELWSLFEFLNPGMLGGASVFQMAGDSLRKPDEETRQVLAKAVRPFILRRTKAQVAGELPEKIEQTIYCELDATQRKLYNELRDHYRNSLLDRIEREGMGKARIHVLEALLRLRQAACHPGLIDPKRAGESSAKLEALLPQVSEVVAEGHKALVFSQFTSLLALVRKQLDADGIAYEYLDGKTRHRQECVDRFQNDPECRLFLVSLKAGGVGLNLCAAEYVFLLDPWWNPAVEAQAIDRAHRIGQANTVFAYRLIARETVEEKVIELENTKRDLADAIIRADTRLVRSLNREDLQLLLS